MASHLQPTATPAPSKRAIKALFHFPHGKHKQGLLSGSFFPVPLLLDAVLFPHWAFFVSLLLVPVSAHSSAVLWRLHTPGKISRWLSQTSLIHNPREIRWWQLYSKSQNHSDSQDHKQYVCYQNPPKPTGDKRKLKYDCKKIVRIV